MSSPVPLKSPQEVNDLLDDKDFELVDVRSQEEFSGELGHVPGSHLKTLGDELDVFLEEADKNKKIVFICRSGRRSEVATLQALERGFKSVYNMDGGMLMWNELNLRRS